MTITAALLDRNDVYLRIDTLPDPSALTPRHLPQITACDLRAGRYKWIADVAGPMGGAFWPLDWLNRTSPDQRAVALHAEIVRLRAANNSLPGPSRTSERSLVRAAKRNVPRS